LIPRIVSVGGPELGLFGLILSFAVLLAARAAARSARRLRFAQIRDELVNAARAGEINVTDQRVFALIDWFDRVANTGRKPAAGRHTSRTPVSTSEMAASLASAIGPGSALGPGGPFWPYRREDGDQASSDVYERALTLQGQLTGRRRPTDRPEWTPESEPGAALEPVRRDLGPASSGITPAVRPRVVHNSTVDLTKTEPDVTIVLPTAEPVIHRVRFTPARRVSREDLVVVTGHPKPVGALVPVTGALPVLHAAVSTDELSLKERIFAVAGGPEN
jgi:hypothetical protein